MLHGMLYGILQGMLTLSEQSQLHRMAATSKFD